MAGYVVAVIIAIVLLAACGLVFVAYELGYIAVGITHR
jgi:hypothetical protein